MQLANDSSQQAPSHTALPFRHNVYSYESSEESGAAELVFAGVDSS